MRSNSYLAIGAYAEDENLGEGIVQTVEGFIPGSTYGIGFEYLGSGLFPGINDIQCHVFFDAVDVDQTPEVSSGSGEWISHMSTFTAGADTHTISFRAMTVDDRSCGSAAIDNFIIEDLTEEAETPPIASFDQSSEIICVEDCITFTNTSEFEETVQWEFSGGSPSTSSAAEQVEVCYDDPGTYSVKLTVENEDGLDSLIVKSAVTVHPWPEGELIQVGDSLRLSADRSQEGVTRFLNDNELPSSEYLVPPIEPGLYQVKLTPSTEYHTSLFILVTAAQENEPEIMDVWVPNAVTFDVGIGLEGEAETQCFQGYISVLR